MFEAFRKSKKSVILFMSRRGIFVSARDTARFVVVVVVLVVVVVFLLLLLLVCS